MRKYEIIEKDFGFVGTEEAGARPKFAKSYIPIIGLVLMLAGCASNPIATDRAPELFKQGCAAASYAHGAFLAASPALVVSGNLSDAEVAKEAAIFASVEATCATPPADLATAGLALIGQASTIYLMLRG
jgi:hypothetical protein